MTGRQSRYCLLVKNVPRYHYTGLHKLALYANFHGKSPHLRIAAKTIYRVTCERRGGKHYLDEV